MLRFDLNTPINTHAQRHSFVRYATADAGGENIRMVAVIFPRGMP